MTGFFESPLFFGEETLNAIHLFIGRWFDYIMYGFTVMGNETFYTAVPPVVYWCYEKNRAFKIIVIFLVCSAVNSIAKELFHMPRPDPAQLLPGIRELNIAYKPKGYGFPSGHTQYATAFWGSIFWYFKHPAIRTICVLLILIIPYSRLYLAVHYFGDVVGGYVIGLAVVMLCIAAIYLYEGQRERIHEAVEIAAALLLPLLVFMIFPVGYVHSALGTLSGLTAGAVLAEKRIRYNPKSTIAVIAARIAIGLAGFFILKYGLKMIFPDMAAFGYLRYMMLGIWCTLAAPFIFSSSAFLRGRDQE